ncbi:hypothetical protein A2U01_0068696, partial [Trifolium medium]|nr:hypothetical protein [Trifolium medium]
FAATRWEARCSEQGWILHGSLREQLVAAANVSLLVAAGRCKIVLARGS